VLQRVGQVSEVDLLVCLQVVQRLAQRSAQCPLGVGRESQGREQSTCRRRLALIGTVSFQNAVSVGPAEAEANREVSKTCTVLCGNEFTSFGLRYGSTIFGSRIWDLVPVDARSHDLTFGDRPWLSSSRNLKMLVERGDFGVQFVEMEVRRHYSMPESLRGGKYTCKTSGAFCVTDDSLDGPNKQLVGAERRRRVGWEQCVLYGFSLLRVFAERRSQQSYSINSHIVTQKHCSPRFRDA